MKLVFFTHPPFLSISSMTRYASWLVDDMTRRGHEVQIWTPNAVFHRLPVPFRMRKWMGYIDQYVVFPFQVKWRLLHQPQETLYIFTDHALGPWVPLINRPKRPALSALHPQRLPSGTGVYCYIAEDQGRPNERGRCIEPVRCHLQRGQPAFSTCCRCASTTQDIEPYVEY
jgi:hypothetical protein